MGQSAVAHSLGEANETCLGEQQIGGIRGDADIAVPGTVPRPGGSSRMGCQPERIEVYLVVVGLIAGSLHHAIVGAHRHQAHAVEIPLAPVPVVKGFKAGQRLADQFEVVIAAKDALHAPGQQRSLRVAWKCEPVLAAEAGRPAVRRDEVGHHAVRVFRLRLIPSILEIPVILVDAANELLAAGKNRQQVGEKGRVP